MNNPVERLTSYDPNYGWGEHRYRITIMQDDYVGHVYGTIRGNVKGASVLEYALEGLSDAERLESDCHFEPIDDDYERYFRFKLTNPAGDTLTDDGATLHQIVCMVVAVEIIGYEPEKKKG